ncbi:SIR2 family protein [Marinobacter sp. NFXS11]|uniref:SIR2 family protein n=1 Tax=Marinobacter sp. NFXS11 TaxID=2818432 RepID=UPI0032DE48FC
MRFLEEGPDIPDRLLQERDAGRVVFLCGAGVSMPFFPSFPNLTKYVIDQLKPSPQSPAYQAFEAWSRPQDEATFSFPMSLDQIFNLLQMEFGREKINLHVAKCLTAKELPPESHDHHGIIARISTDGDGTPQIVTTNFDLLFEAAIPAATRHTPPSFPDLKHGTSVSGITYLHGRLDDSDNTSHDYILSSSDFGRAYLVQGWATNFVRQLLESYTVVLLGYQAEDPPIKYLLQGLNSSYEYARDRIYAFDQGSSEEVGSKWADRGVTPIPYGGGADHSALWNTLSEWAKRADNPRLWRESIINLAQKKPDNCMPYERGMLVHLVNTTIGAKEFADANPAPPVDWLCVFDKNVRYGQPTTRTFGNNETFDPQCAFGLDSDPPRPEPDPLRSQLNDCEDPVNWKHGDESLDYTERLAGLNRPVMSARLRHLTRWAVNQIDQPLLAWWVARQHQLHPAMIEHLDRQIDSSEKLNSESRAIWRNILEALRIPQIDPHNIGWYKIKDMVKKDGWSPSATRFFESVMEPVFAIKPPLGIYLSKPPEGNWSETPLHNILRLQVHFPSTHGESIDCPDQNVRDLYKAFERNLILASQRLADVGGFWLSPKSLYPEHRTDTDAYVSEESAYLDTFVKILLRMAELDPEAIRAHVKLWPKNDPYFFDKLRLFIWNNAEITSIDDVVSSIQKFTSEQLWSPDNRRELLFLLRDRWSETTDRQRSLLCKKLLAANSDLPSDHDFDAKRHHQRRFVRTLAWLQSKGCKLPPDIEDDYSRLKQLIDNWSDEWVQSAASANDMRSGAVQMDTDPSIFDHVPIGDIADIALSEDQRRNPGDFVEPKPFIGLVKASPHRALAALADKASTGEYPWVLWEQLYSNWPEDQPLNQTRRFYAWMRQLPNDVLLAMKGCLGDWFRNRFPSLAARDELYAYSMFDELLAKLISNGAKATPSTILEQRRAGIVVKKSRKTIFYARNSVIGDAMEGLLRTLDSKKDTYPEGIPQEIGQRILGLLNSPGEGADHAVCNVCLYIPWLNSLDPDWTNTNVMPLLSLNRNTAEPAWSGLMSNPWTQVRSFFPQIKSDYIELPLQMEEWGWDEDTRGQFNYWLVLAAVAPSTEDGLSFDDAREILRKVPQSGREKVINALTRIGANKDGWNRFVIPFVKEAWPQDLRYQDELTTKAWLALLDDTGASFPDVFNVVREFLRPVYSMSLSLFRFHHMTGEKEPLTVKYPEIVLDMVDRVVAQNATRIPYDLSQILTLLEDTKPEIISDRKFYRLRELEQSM